MAKRNMWTYEETLEMLNIMLEQESLKAMNGRPFRKDKAFRLVQEEMIQRGYETKDPKQIEYRWKNLKKRYMDLQKDPSLADKNPFQYYDEIDIMMKGKPSTEDVKLFDFNISKGDNKNEYIIETTFPNEPEPSTSTDGKRNSPIAANNEEVVEEIVVKNEWRKPAPARSHRTKRGKYQRHLREKSQSHAVPHRVTEEEVLQNQKRLIDYQFGLYSKAQEETDRKFLNMSRELLERSNEQFQSFIEKLVSSNVQDPIA